MTLFPAGCTSTAVFSPCRQYRYRLTRRWGDGNRFACFIALNPSTADEHQNDPTVRRMIGYAMSWGMDGLHVANIFALRSTDPRALKTCRSPIGMDNDGHILAMAASAEIIIAAWGTHGRLHGRGLAVHQMLLAAGMKVLCLGRNADGSPKHPLYVRADVVPMPLAGG